MKIAQPQTKRTIAVSILLSAAASAVTGFAAQRAVFIAVTLVLAAVNILYIADSVMRYKKISRYNDMLGKVLYSDEKINFEEYKEGELSILNSEIQKLIRKLRDDARLLKKQKNQLADSMADISHQIKTPLTSANIVVDLLSAESISDERRIALLNQLQMLLDRIVW